MSARRSSARRQASPPKQQVRNRGLLVVTLLLVGAFAVGLAYIKQNAPAQRTAQTGTVAAVSTEGNTATSAAPAVSPAVPQQSVLQSIKPKYDFYNELPKRQLVIGQDEINRRDKRELQAPPKQESAQQKAKEKPQQSTAVADKVPAKNKAPAETAQTRAKPKAVEMPKIELISRQGRSSDKPAAAKPAAASAQTANTAPSGSWMIQAGAYSTFDDADRIRAKLAIMGIRARVEAGVSNNKPIHRVRIGPLLSKSVAENLNRRLSENNIPALLLKTN
ncbi:MAG: SPOR domain-containing protein [Gammaproteobacteria bacterium]